MCRGPAGREPEWALRSATVTAPAATCDAGLLERLPSGSYRAKCGLDEELVAGASELVDCNPPLRLATLESAPIPLTPECARLYPSPLSSRACTPHP